MLEPAELEPYVSAVENGITVGNDWSQILQADPGRVAVLFLNPNNSQFTVYPFEVTDNTQTRFVVPPANQPPNSLFFTTSDHGPLVRHGWWARALGALQDPPIVILFQSSIDYVNALSRFVTTPGA